MRQEFVTFYSPGTFFSETTTKPIDRRDVVRAVQLAADISERYNAKPYGFRFETRLVADPVSDGEGGTLRVQDKTVDASGTHYLNGKLETVTEVDARNDPKESILRSNMHGNETWIVVVVVNGFRSVSEFSEKDVIVDAAGIITKRGDDPDLVSYRAKMTAEKRMTR